MDHTGPVGNHLDQFDSSVGEWRREKDNFTSASDKLGNFCRLWAGAWSHKWANKSQTKVFLAESSVCLGCKMFSDMKGSNTHLPVSLWHCDCSLTTLAPFGVAALIVTYWWPIGDHFGTSWKWLCEHLLTIEIALWLLGNQIESTFGPLRDF